MDVTKVSVQKRHICGWLYLLSCVLLTSLRHTSFIICTTSTAVRKICPKCGTHSLTRRKTGHIHGSSRKMKEEPIRPLSGLVLQLPGGRRHSAESTFSRRLSVGSTEQMSDDSDDSFRLSEEEQDEREIEQFRQQPGLRASSLRMARRKCTRGW